MPSYIADGYTRDDGYIAAPLPEANGETLWEPLEFTYRPATRQEWVTLDAAIRIAIRNQDIDPTCAYKAEQMACKFVADHVLAWNLTHSGVVLPVCQATLEHVNSGLFTRLYSIIRGARASDPKPGSETAKQPLTDAEQLKN